MSSRQVSLQSLTPALSAWEELLRIDLLPIIFPDASSESSKIH